MFFQRSNNHKTSDIAIGASYIRQQRNGCLERAEIVNLRHDEMGILHVQYHYMMEQQGRSMFSDMRTLAAQAFYAQFCHGLRHNQASVVS